jgi:hypothetical protein
VIFRLARIAALVVVVSALAAARGPAADDIETMLPRDYAGDFLWVDGTISQKVAIRINLITRAGPTQVEAVGCGRYEVLDRVTDIGVQLLIDTESLAIEIREFSPSGAGARNFVTDGSHKGRLSRDLKTIEAEWTTLSDGRRGRLRLEAGPAITCAIGVAQAVPAGERGPA